MILYCVNIEIDSEIAAAWTTWMRGVHIPDVMRTGCFLDSQLFRNPESVNSARLAFEIHYQCRDLETLQRYRADWADQLQAEHTQRFQGRFQASRTVLELLD